MSPPTDPQGFEDLTHSCGGNAIFNPTSLMDSGRDLSQYMYIQPEELQPGAYLQATEYLPATSTHNVGPAFQRGSSLGFDLSSTYASGDYFYPLQNEFAPSNAFLPMQGSQHTQPLLPYTQQLLSYSIQHPSTNEELAQDDPFSVYPPLGDHNASHSLPYGDWVIRGVQQNCPPPILNPYSVNAGYTTSDPYQPDNTQTEVPRTSTRTVEVPAAPSKVSMSRKAKRSADWDPEGEVRRVYPTIETRGDWGTKTWEHEQHLFSYDEFGRWKSDRFFSNEQLREYVDGCPEGTVFRVQQAPTQCNRRMTEGDRKCRWANCPAKSKTITSGWLRVCFDEFSEKTSSGERNPFENAGSMHLWCFEQVFDLMEFHMSKRLIPETRVLPGEEKNVTRLAKLTDTDIVKEAYTPWFEKQKAYFEKHGKFPVIRQYEDSLSFAMNHHHLKNQTPARENTRRIRKKDGIRITIDVHLGDLQKCVKLKKELEQSKKAHREQKREGGDHQPDASPASQLLRTQQRRSLSGSDKERYSGRRHRKEIRRHALATQPPAGQNPSTNACSSLSPYSFDTLGPACSTQQPTFRPSLKVQIPYFPAMPESKTWAQEAQEAGEEAPKELGYGDGTSSDGLIPNETNLFIAHPDLLEINQYLAEGTFEDSFTAQAQTSQPLEIAACTESPHVAAVAEPWFDVASVAEPWFVAGSFMDPPLPLFEETVDGLNGEV